MLSATLAVTVTSCSTSGTSGPYELAYRAPAPDQAFIRAGRAVPPRNAPLEVVRAIDAANRIVGLPYKWGGGHAILDDTGYDCSGATSYVLRNAGLMESQMPSRGFLRYGENGHGKWISVIARDGHVYLVIAGLRFDTQGQGRRDGPKWRYDLRSTKGHVVRHPKGF